MTARSTDKSGARDLKAFGWQGINLTVPGSWELVSTRGRYDSGYLGLADDAGVRLELKWDLVRGKTDLAEVANKYIQELRKQAKKSRTDITVKRDVKLAVLKGKQIECYEWTADTRGTGMVSRCEECRRLVHVIILGKPDESLRKLARMVFASVKDHSEDGKHLWQFYDMQFAVPKDIPLERSELKTGCIKMLFEKRSRHVEFVRVSLAETLLADKSLRKWFDGFYTAPLKHWHCKITDAQFKGHSGLRLDGKAWLVVNPTALLGGRRLMRLACWHCDASNRLFIVRHNSPRGEEEVFEQAVESFQCCGTQ